MGAIMHGLRAEPAPPGWAPRALSPQQADLLGTLVDLIIPPTDTPGAKAVGVHVFIDKMLEDWVGREGRLRFERGLAEVDQETRRLHRVGFVDATREQQVALLTRLDREASRARSDGVRPLPFFATLKEWTLVGYYTSEIGATQELRWLAVPGRYEADLPFEKVGRTWA